MTTSKSVQYYAIVNLLFKLLPRQPRMPVGYNIVDSHECESLYRDSCEGKQNWVTLKVKVIRVLGGNVGSV